MNYAERTQMAYENSMRFATLMNIVSGIILLTIVIIGCIVAIWAIAKFLFKKEQVNEEEEKVKTPESSKEDNKTTSTSTDEETKETIVVSSNEDTPAPVVTAENEEQSTPVIVAENEETPENIISVKKPESEPTPIQQEVEDDEDWLKDMDSVFQQLQGDDASYSSNAETA